MREDDIIVTANRYGEAKVAAETEFNEDEITAQALNRLAVLKPEAAAQYGYPSGKRVVNLVLKRRFTSLNADAGISAATAGGQVGGNLSAGRVAIDGATRWNAQGRIGRQSALFRSARSIPAEDGVDGDFETLLPSRRSMSFNAGVTRPLGNFSAALNVHASSTGGNALRGLAPDTDRALRSDNSSRSLGAGFNLTGRIADWQTSLAANYSRSSTQGLFETGLDLPDDRLPLASRTRSRGENFNARLNVSAAIADLQAGPITSNVSVDVSRSHSENRRSDSPAGPIAVDERSRGQANGQASFNVPLSRRGEAEIGGLGDLSLDLSLSGQAQSENGLQTRYGGGVTWSPISIVQLRASFEHAGTAPSFDQLDGPLVTTIDRIFDFAQAETVDVVRITGGNPDLGRGSRQSLSLNARVLPFDDQTLALTMGYRAQSATGGVAGFPALTPVIEAAFPERVTRDATGRLVAIDARAITIARDASAELTSGIALRPPRRGGADAVPFSATLNHRWRLKDELLTRPGVPVIDQLGGSGQSRHSLTLQLTAGKRGLGATINGNWSTPARVQSAQDFRFKAPAIVNLSAFVEPEHVLSGAGAWMKNLKFSLDVQNALNGYRRVTLGDGSIPPGYSRDEIDPLGRTMRLTVRKRF